MNELIEEMGYVDGFRIISNHNFVNIEEVVPDINVLKPLKITLRQMALRSMKLTAKRKILFVFGGR